MTLFKEEVNVLDYLSSEIASLPASLEESTLQYDHNGLILVLREKEILKVCGATPEQNEQLNNYDREFGPVVSNLVKERDIEAAFERYLSIEKKIEQEMNGNLYIYARQMALSVKSLYYYKKKQFDMATAFTIECVALNEYLVRQGLHTLIFRCLEQNKNISRIRYRSGDDEGGNAFLLRLFEYMFNGTDQDLYGVIFKDPAFYDRQVYIREAYTYETVRMIVEDMIRISAKQLYPTENSPFPWFLQLEFEVNTLDRQIIYNWMYVNRQLWENNYTHYFESLIEFLKEPVSQLYDVLKLHLMMGAARVVRESEYKGKDKILDEIKTYIQTKLTGYQTLRARIIDNI
ncbi:hypothetical protein [Chitinophaga vietnamensis]|uniref:hypothetical protein n=1 Tax=Chitinophaga vietnamensis TaxID=2593957 RepID=UPI0011785B97|nr:hypothetical protein [Chitinophaga vietnamensis]